jgi:hypothetical protein
MVAQRAVGQAQRMSAAYSGRTLVVVAEWAASLPCCTVDVSCVPLGIQRHDLRSSSHLSTLLRSVPC